MWRPSFSRFWWNVRSQSWGNEWKIAVAAGVAAVAALVALWPRWTLDYMRVLSWPGVVLLALILFRWPIHALLQESALEGGGFGPLNLRFGQRQSERQEGLAAALSETSETVEGLQAQVDQHAHGLGIAGALLQIYDVQLQFLRHLRTATPPVTAAAAETWFTNATKAAVDAGAPLDPPALIGWLNNQQLIVLNLQGAYEVTPTGQDVLTLAENFWYAPKLL